MDIVVIGHLSRDLLITPELTRETLGGGTAYAVLAPSVGAENSWIVSKVGADFESDYLHHLRSSGLNLSGLKVEGPLSTRYVNEYDSEGRRTQRVESLAPSITVDDLSQATLESRTFHFCPLSSEEIDHEVFERVSQTDAIVSLDAQGFLRRIEDGQVKPCSWPDCEAVLQYVDILKLDAGELIAISGTEDEAVAVEAMLDLGPRVIAVTRDREGSTIFTAAGRTDIPLVLAHRLVDTTGSGDTYAIGFLLEYLRTENIRQSGLFAASCASFNLESIGPYKMPSRDQVVSRISRLE